MKNLVKFINESISLSDKIDIYLFNNEGDTYCIITDNSKAHAVEKWVSDKGFLGYDIDDEDDYDKLIDYVKKCNVFSGNISELFKDMEDGLVTLSL